jgi:hypothetical protein
MAPLMSSPEALSNLPVAPSDPVEMRRLKFQTPAMMSHPPIHIADLEEHINNLKTSDNLKFSQEYEVRTTTIANNLAAPKCCKLCSSADIKFLKLAQ